jgi:glutathionyl-hydroquinone reductase
MCFGLLPADIRLFVTLIRFDAAYHGLFRCNLRRVADYPNLKVYVDRIHAMEAIASTVRIHHIAARNYSIRTLNPSGIVSLGPA